MDAPRDGDPWEEGSSYERYVGRWSRQVALEFLAWLRRPAGLRWLDVGCGTGALCATIVERCAPSSVAGVEPSEGFRGTAHRSLGSRAEVHPGSATAIPLEDASVDVVVSGLVLNFVPDPPAALAEMLRVTRPGGTIAAYVWDYAGRMEFMRAFWDAAVALDPAAAAADEGIRFPLCRPEPLKALFASSGLGDIEVRAIDIRTTFVDFEDYWRPFLGGQGPAPAYAMSIDEAARARLREAVRARVPITADGSISMVARAWAIRAGA
jgi:SAM-dependent methyltransferase